MSSSAAMKVLSGRRWGRAIGRANTIVWEFAFQPSGHYSVVVGVRPARVDRKVCTSSVVNSFGLNYDKFVRFHFISQQPRRVVVVHWLADCLLNLWTGVVGVTLHPWLCSGCCCYDFALWRLSFKLGPPCSAARRTVVWVVVLNYSWSRCMAHLAGQELVLCYPVWICIAGRNRNMVKAGNSRWSVLQINATFRF